MRIAVLGAGVVGVTTAYELMKDGHEVTVLERLGEVAAETSFANAGLIAPGHAYAWSSPRAPRILWKSLFEDGQALRFRPSLDPALWSWTGKFLRNCTAERARINTRRKVRLCRYSQERLHQITEEAGISYHGRRGGLLYLYRQPETLERGAANSKILTEEGVVLRVIGRDEAARLDPALEAVKQKFAGAIYAPGDESGDARVFAEALAAYTAQRGVTYRFETEVTHFETSGDRVTAAMTNASRVSADAFVMCLGAFSPRLARQLGVRLPIYPVKGYSVTLPIGANCAPPTLGGVDEDNLCAWARFGDRLRVTATAELAGFDRSHRPDDFTHMLGAIRGLFPDGADWARPSYWAGLRPMTPEGTPRFGRGRHLNLYYNVGHGHMGWTMAAGSARIAADLLRGERPAVPLDGMKVAV